MEKTPKELGFKMPAEWQTHSAVWLSWPYDRITFPERVEKVEQKFAELISAIHHSENVELLVLNDEMQKRAKNLLEKNQVDFSKITFRQTDYADVWLRDTGPTFVKNAKNQLLITKWRFNAWGNKFPDLLKDDALVKKISSWTKIEFVNPGLVIEGGAIDVNGQGLCLTTEQCLLNQNRNPGKTKEDVEKFLHNYLGIEKTIWLKEGLINDHTDGHIDELARFVAPNKIVCAYEEDKKDENYKILNANYKTLSGATNIQGSLLEIVKLPMPHMRYDDGTKAPVSYANFYIGNEVILVPQFNDPNDGKALGIIQSCFPKRKLVAIDCRDLIYGGGAIHCITQQQPLI